MGGGTLPLIHLTTSSSSSSSSSVLPNRRRLPSSSALNFPVSSVNSNNSTTALAAKSCCCSASSCCCCPAPGGVCTRLLALDSARGKQEYVFGPVPDLVEVETAIASLQNFMQGIPSSGLELNLQLQQMLDYCSTNVTATLLSHGYERVRDAFNLLQTDPSVKRLVASLSSDKAVWDAVMNNEAVLELQQSAQNIRIQSGGGSSSSSDEYDDDPDISKRILGWIIEMTKAKVGELIHNFQSLLNDVFQPLEKGKPRDESRDEMDEKVRSSLILSIVILLIVVLARSYRL